MTSAFVLQNKISSGDENIILKKAYDYYRPILSNQIDNLSGIDNDPDQLTEEGYFGKLFEKLHHLGPEKMLEVIHNIGDTIKRDSLDDISEDRIENITSDVFDLVSGLLFMENPGEALSPLDISIWREQYGLTPKETEVVSLVYEGYSNHEISGLMGNAVSTVKQHLYSIFNKVGVENRTHLIYKIFKKI